MLKWVNFFSLLMLVSCGYRAANSEEKKTISVPYIEGDQQGQLTAEVIRQLQETGYYDFVRRGGDLVLKAVIVGDQKETIGFSYDRKGQSGKIEKNLMATENRRNLTVEIQLLEGDKVILGPLKITAAGEFDYVDVNSLQALSFINDRGRREKVVNFSLGQLDSIEGAEDNVLTPTYRGLARKIAAALVRDQIMISDG
jgi:hypothetical protein